MGFSYRAYPGFQDLNGRYYLIKSIYNAMEKLYDIPDLVRVYAVKKMIMEPNAKDIGRDEKNGKLRSALGIFRWRAKTENSLYGRTDPTISICVHGRSEKELIHTCLHEFVHYEQYRNHKNITERGVSVRIRSICWDIMVNDVMEKDYFQAIREIYWNRL